MSKLTVGTENTNDIDLHFDDHGSGDPVVLIHGSLIEHLDLRDIAEFASPKGTHDCIEAFSYTDFRGDLERFDPPTLVIHGDSDAIVPFEVSGKRTHESISGSELALIEGGRTR